MGSGVDLQEFVAGFILEADEHLLSVNRNLVAVAEALKAHRLEPRGVRELFRSFHTIKGLASMVGADPVADITHEMEGILRTADRAGGRLSEHALDLLVKGTRVIEDMVKTIPKSGVARIPKAPARLLEDLVQTQKSEHSPTKDSVDQVLDLPTEISRSLSVGDREQAAQGLAGKRRLIIIDFEPSPEHIAAGLNITSVRERLSKIAELIKVTPHASDRAPTGIAFYLLLLTDFEPVQLAQAVGLALNSVTEAKPSESAAQKEGLDVIPELTLFSEEEFPESDSASLPTQATSVRVDIRKLDEVLERLSELIVTRSKLSKITSELSSRGVDTRELSAVVAENGRQLKRLRTAITEARMVSLSELLQRLPLVVRGLTKDPSKAVDLFVQAGSAEVDKAVADKLFPAIVHLIRNSVDHAIEDKVERQKVGKDEIGVITVNCDDSSGATLSVSISDDGRGIDRQAVAKKLGQPVAKTDSELLRQICTPGLSTRENVSQTSGRGMGMDIVKKTIEMLGGSLELTTREGKGTKFLLRVPVSITIVDVLSFISGSQTFVAPIAMIDEIVEVKADALVSSPMVAGGEVQPRLFSRRGESIPFLVLDSILNNRPDHTIPTRALIVNQINGAVAFGVDRMLGQQEVVVRPLDNQLVHALGLNGAADLGDGRPTLVLDLASLGSEFSKVAEVIQ